MMEAVSTPETSVNFYYATWYSIPEHNHLHNDCLYNYKINWLPKDNLILSQYSHM
jgi:hypothetical protein